MPFCMVARLQGHGGNSYDDIIRISNYYHVLIALNINMYFSAKLGHVN